MRIIPESELIINSDGSAFHLHIKPEQLSDKIVMMGDPDRVTMTASFFDTIECDVQSREFHTVTGMYKGKRITALSHGIGTDNIDIVLTELDALANIDFNTRKVKDEFKQLTMIRVGTSGGMQPHCPVGSYVVSEKSIGFDGLIHYYANSAKIREEEFEEAFQRHVNWSPYHCSPYVVSADEELVDRIGYDMIRGVTISAIGFYGPQGRHVRLPLAYPELNARIESFSFNGYSITNYEMESSAIAGLSKLMGHKAMTVCAIIANRVALNSNADYKGSTEDLVKIVLDRI
ncbi:MULTISPECIES: nucleoside phosphorylase [Proteiniphilum]|jgi:uridine phosphorylase|uniref:nucleoside phosphorylase n=1 Tax=Proteiniphilum TaxID=294702 RepID=UPI001EEA04A7|nr:MULTISPECIES: nucleoside phosphorylase [Proteiniphilum]MDD2245653.1 nucleoside phosphorylase [Proteiniphilum sp.]MDD3910094.1 nucleoside phosphorylase [Proteiniphilum sp.]MDD4415402.1 nucleoside phosphorylase [Proteiniphilum sp.]ULB35805.1 nucleoside phosphorylase [Proteiniphilum propionicum]